MRKIVLILLAFLTIGHLLGQDVKWSVTPPHKYLTWMKPLSNGMLLIGSVNGITCLNRDDGSTAWTIGSITKSEFKDCNPIPFTNLVIFGKVDPKIVNTKEGKIVFDAQSNGISSLSFKKILPHINAILLLGSSKEGNKLLLVDYSTGSVKWVANMGKDKGGAGRFAAKFVSAHGPKVTVFDNDIKLTSDGNFLFTSSGKLYKISLQSGEIKWQYTPKKQKAKMIFITPDNKSVLVASGAVTGVLVGNFVLESLDLESGKQNWKEIAFKGVFDKIIFDEDIALINGSRVFQQLEYKTGKRIGKEYPANGMILRKSLKTNDGYLLYKEANENSFLVYYIGFDGNAIWKRPATTPKIYDFKLIDNELFVFSKKYFGPWDLATKKPIKDKGTNLGTMNTWLYDKSDDTYVGYSSEQKRLVKMSKDGYSVKLLAEISFFKDNEEPLKIEMRPEGYFLRSQQNLYMAGLKGEEIHHTYYPKSRSGLIGELNKYTTSMPISTELEVTNPEKNLYITDAVDKAIYESYVKAITNSSSAVLTTVDKSNSSSIAVMSIDKTTGNILKQVNLHNYMATYTIDPIYQVLYYLTVSGKINAYKL